MFLPDMLRSLSLDAAADHFLLPAISGRQAADWLSSLDFPCQGVLHSSLGLLAVQLIGSRQDRRLELAFRSRGVDVFTTSARSKVERYAKSKSGVRVGWGSANSYPRDFSQPD